MSITEIQEAIDDGYLTYEELMKIYLDRIDKYNDKYILHRIIKIKDNIITTAGDYNYFIDKKINRSLLLGKLVEIRKKDGRVINLNKDKKMRKFFYSNFIYIRMPIQYLLSKLHIRKIK